MRKWIYAVALPLGVQASALADAKLTMQPNGHAVFDNGLVTTTVTNKPGRDQGIRQWKFGPTGGEMVDKLYGQTDFITGGMLNETFDRVAATAKLDSETYGVVSGGVPPITTTYYVTYRAGDVDNGRAALLEQVAQAGGFRLQRTLVFRRDLAAIEARYVLENIDGPRMGSLLRLWGVMSPGARGPSRESNHTLFVPVDGGVLAADQALAADQYVKEYGRSFFYPPNGQKVPSYASNKKRLTESWAALVHKGNGDGMVFVSDSPNFFGFYGHPGMSVEPFFKPVDLSPGSKHEFHLIIGSFTGAVGATVSDATALYVATESLKATGGKLAGKVIPTFKGKLQLIDDKGGVAGEWPASPDAVIAIAGNTGDAWAIKAVDTKGSEIGSVTAKGELKLSPVDLPTQRTEPPSVSGDIYIGDEAAISGFLAKRDFTVYCDNTASKREKQVAREIAAKIGVGIMWARPQGKVLVVGEPSTNATVADVGKMRNTISKQWPGADRGAILSYGNFEGTANAILLVTGGDDLGVVKAAKAFSDRFLQNVEPPKGIELWAPHMEERIYPYSRRTPRGTNAIKLSVARGEYEAAMIGLTAHETARDINVTVTTPKHRDSGKELGGKYLTKFRKEKGPVWLRWIDYYPLKNEDGWTGYADPLLEQPVTLINGGESRGMWLTFIVPDDATAGMYDSTLTVKSSAGEKTLPISIEVYDFNIPATGLLGHPYMAMDMFAEQGGLVPSDRVLAPLVTNMVEHGMRIITPVAGETFRWQFSATGEFKGIKAKHFEVSDDGKVMLDCTRWAELVDMCDKAAKPFELTYVIYTKHLHAQMYGEFKRVLPNRYPDKEPVPADEETPHKSWYSVEMFQLFERYLKRTGTFEHVLVKAADEPPSFAHGFDNTCWSLRKTNLQIFTALNNVDWKDAERGLGSQLKLWQPVYMITDEKFLKRAQEAGAKVSWYNCGPPPRTSVGEQRSALRAYLWQAARCDLDAVSWWGVQCWTQAGGRDTVWLNKYSHWHSLVYPPHPDKPPVQVAGKGWIDQGPLDSVRWEFIRDGMDDAAYVKKLRELIAYANKTGKADLAKKGQATLDDIFSKTFPTLNDYRPPYDTVVQCRDRVARDIVELKTAMKLK